MRTRNSNTVTLVVLLLVGIIIGSIIGDLIGDKVEFLSRSYSLGLKEPIRLDIKVLQIDFRFMLNINVTSILGVIIVLIIYRKL